MAVLNRIVVTVHQVEEHAQVVPLDRVNLGYQHRAVEPVKAVDQEDLGAIPHAGHQCLGGKGLAAVIGRADSHKEERVWRCVGVDSACYGHSVRPTEAVGAGVDAVAGGRVARQVEGISGRRLPGDSHLPAPDVLHRQVGRRLREKRQFHTVSLLKILDDALVDGAGGQLVKARLFERIGVIGVIVVGHLDQCAGHTRLRIVVPQLAQFAQVHTALAPIHPAGVPAGADVVHQFIVHRLPQLGAALCDRLALAAVDETGRAAGDPLIAVIAIGVPGDVDGVVAGAGVLPAGIDGPGGHVAIRRGHPHPLDVIVGRHLPPGFVGWIRSFGLDAGQVVKVAPAEAHRVGDDHGPGHDGLIGQNDLGFFAASKAIVADVVPGDAMMLLIHHHRGLSSGVVDGVVGIGGAVGARPVPDVDGVAAIGGQGGGPGGSRCRRTGHCLSPAIVAVLVAGANRRRPDAGLDVARVRGRIVVVHHDGDRVHIPLAGGPNHRAGVL